MSKTLHLFMLLALILIGGGISANAAEEDLTATSSGFTSEISKIEFAKNSGSTAPTWNAKSSEYRLYGKGTLTITPKEGITITQVDYTFNKNKNSKGSVPTAKLSSTEGTLTVTDAGATWTGTTTSAIVLLADGTAGNFGFTALKITYSEASTGKTKTTLAFADPADRTINLNADNGTTVFTNAAVLTPAVEGATITYSSDNVDVATVESNGEVAVDTKAVGSATITATFAGNDQYDGATASYKISVIDPNKASWSYTFQSGDLVDGTTDFTFNDVAWTFTPTWKSEVYYGNLVDKGLQLGSGSNPATSLVFSSKGFPGVINEVKVNAATGSSATATISVTVGGVSYGDAQELTASSADYTFTGSASGEVVITLSQPSTSKALYIKSIDVEYNPSAAVKTNTQVAFENDDYTITQDAIATDFKTYTNKATVTTVDGTPIAGAAVTYSSSDKDHADVDATTGEVTIDQTVAGTYTITASYAGDDTYAASSATYTITVEENLNLTGAGTEDNPYTVADALTIINKDRYKELGNAVYVKGIISRVVSKAPSKNYGSLNYDISDDGQDENYLYVYGGLKKDGAQFTSASEIAVGDIVLLKGDLQTYGNKKTPELNSNNTLEKFYERAESLDENSTESTVAAGHNVTATVKRTFNDGAWNTLVLPFDVTAEQITAAFGANAKVASYTGATQNTDDTYTLNFTETKTITANLPVFIYGAEANADGYTFTGVEVKDATPTQEAEGFNFVGTYVKTNVPQGNYFLNSQNKLYKAADDKTNIKGTRATFAPVDAATEAKGLGFNVTEGGETTAINAVTMQAEAYANAPMFNLAGQRVTKAYKGVVLQNGKKYIQK